ncbi:MAG: tetratricopeptide repeat protein [Geitlerinemataceae cyanobacterium]
MRFNEKSRTERSRLYPIFNAMILSAWLLLPGNTAPVLGESPQRSEILGQPFFQENDAASREKIDLPNPPLVWVMGLPLLAGVGVALVLHRLEKRADRDTEILERLQEDALSELSVLVAQSQKVLHNARACLYRPPATVCLDRSPLRLPEDASAIELSKIRQDCQQGDRLVLDGRYAEAIATYNRALLVRRDAHQVWNNQGNAFFYLEQYERAISAYDKALQLKPDYAVAWNNRGSTIAQWQRFPEALTCYEKALEFHPTYAEAWYNRGLILYELGQYTESLLSYDRAVPQWRDQPQLWRHRGRVLVALKQYTAAIAAYDKALQLTPEDLELSYRKAGCYALQGNIDLASETLQQAIDGCESYREQARIDTAFVALRGTPRFQQIVNRSLHSF